MNPSLSLLLKTHGSYNMKCYSCGNKFKCTYTHLYRCSKCTKRIGKPRCQQCGCIVLNGLYCRKCRTVRCNYPRTPARIGYDAELYYHNERIPHQYYYNPITSPTLIWKLNIGKGANYIAVEPTYIPKENTFMVFSQEHGKHIDLCELLAIPYEIFSIVMSYSS